MSTCVFFFGGYHASQTDMDSWRKSAKAQQPNVEFNAFPWPHGAHADADSAVKTFHKSGKFKSAVAAIQASNADEIYVVGHSSGCAIANAVDDGLKDHTKIVLVALDGFTPSRHQLKRSSTQVWAAKCGDVKSRNYPAHLAVGTLNVYQATDCKTMWALHFSLVNAAANDSLVTSVATGYAKCMANLAWL
jgi:hypothetical protein